MIQLLIIHKHPSHHQMTLANSMHDLLGNNFRMAFLDPWQQDRMAMGWPKLGEHEPWVIRTWEGNMENNELAKWNMEADAVIYPGYATWEPANKLLNMRLNHKKLCLPTSERMFKPSTDLFKISGVTTQDENLKLPRCVLRRFRLLKCAIKVNKSNCHYLAQGTYAAYDQSKIGMLKDRCWTWGFFIPLPNTEREKKFTQTLHILCAGRLLDLKKIDTIIYACSLIDKRNIRFELNVIGNGPQENNLKELAHNQGISNKCFFHDFIPMESVRSKMRETDVFILASTADEGWGAVLNEAMSEGCAVICSTGAGASRILIKDSVTGLLFPTGDSEALAERLEFLAKNRDKREEMGRNAAQYMREVWSPAVGAERLVALINGLLGRAPMPEYEDGPCSKAKIFKDQICDRMYVTHDL